MNWIDTKLGKELSLKYGIDKVILSTPMLLETGVFKMTKISLEKAKEFAKRAKNFSGHQTVKILGIEPVKIREDCESFDEALIIKPGKRLEFGKEYTKKEIEKIGYKIYLIEKMEEDY